MPTPTKPNLPDLEELSMLGSSVSQLRQIQDHAFELCIQSDDPHAVAMLAQTVVQTSNSGLLYRQALATKEGQFRMDDLMNVDPAYRVALENKGLPVPGDDLT
jgi:hypothetical protein